MKSVMYRYHDMIEKATAAGSPNKEKTLDAWQRRAIAVRGAMLNIKADYQKELDELRETYSAKTFEEKRQSVDEDYKTLRDVAIKKVADDLEAVLDSKRAQFDRSSSAPSDEDLRLLNALNMRSSLSIAEVAAVSGKFNGNVQAIRVLRDIARKHGISFPDIGDPEQFEEMMERAEQFSTDHIQEIDADRDQLTYKGILFWEHPGEGETRYFYGALDNQGFTTEQISNATTEAQRETATSSTVTNATETGEGQPLEMWAEVKCTGNMSLSTIADQFHVSTEQIRRANPGRTLDRLYSGDRILVPSTQFTFQPDPSGGHVQPGQVKAVPRPIYPEPTGPNGEAVGDDISLM